MKYVQSITFRALSALSIGCLLIAFPDNTTRWLVIVIGVLFLLPGLISIVAYFRLHRESQGMNTIFPLIGSGSLLFGILLISFSKFLINYMVYVLAAFLIMAGISQIVNMLRIRRKTEVGLFFYMMPTLIALAGIFIFVDTKASSPLIYTILSIGSIVYGIVELIIAIYFRKIRRQMTREAQKDSLQTPEPTAEPKSEESESTDSQHESEQTTIDFSKTDFPKE